MENIKSKKVSSLWAAIKGYAGLVIAFLVICAVLSVMTDSFLSAKNLMNVMRQISVNAILAFAMTLVILTGGIDLSVGSVESLAGMICAALIGMYNWPVYIVVPLAIAVGGLIGLFNGLMVCKTSIPAFVVSLATMEIVAGMANLVSNGAPVRVLNDAFNIIGTGYIGPISLPVVYMLILLVFCYVLLQKTRFGRHIYAVGGNLDTARFSGINTLKVRVTAYVLCSSFAALTGVFMVARMYTGQPNLGSSSSIDAIASLVVGGTSLNGGRGKIVGTFIGAMLIGVIGNGMNLLGISSYYQSVAKGIIILLAVYIDIISTKRILGKG